MATGPQGRSQYAYSPKARDGVVRSAIWPSWQRFIGNISDNWILIQIQYPTMRSERFPVGWRPVERTSGARARTEIWRHVPFLRPAYPL